MGAWVLILTAAIFYTQGYGSSDFGEKINSPVTTKSPIFSAESSKGSSKEIPLPELTHADSARRDHSSGSVDIVTEPRKGAPKNVEQTAHYSTPSPQHTLRQNMEPTYDVNSLPNSGYDDNPLAALYEATRAAYIQSNSNSNLTVPHFQSPTIPYNDDHLSKNLLKTNHVPPFSSNHSINSNPPTSTIHQQNTNNRFVPPLQHHAIHETTFGGINNNNFEDYDDGSYDPYKYGDYLYFDDNDYDNYNQDFQKADIPSTVLLTPYQQSQSFHSNHNYQPANNNIQNKNYDYYNQNYQNAHTPLKVLPTPYQQSQSFYSNQNYQSPNINNQQKNYDSCNQNNQNPQIPSKVLPMPHQQSQYFQNNANSTLINNNYQQNIAQHTHSNPLQSHHVPQQKPYTVHKSKNNVIYNYEDARNSIGDSYQVEAAKQYLKEIEEAQEYAKKVLSASTSPAVTHHASQHFPDEAVYNHHQNQPTFSTYTEGRYNNVYLESSHYQPIVRPQVPQAVGVNSLMPKVSKIKSEEQERNNVKDTPIYPSHQEPARNPYSSGYSHYQNQPTYFTNTEERYNNVPLESSQYRSNVRPQIPQAVEVNSIMAHVNEIKSQEQEGNNVEDSPIYPSHQEHAKNPYPSALPVVLPNGFLADTEEVRLAKIEHLQLVLDTLKSLSNYRSKYPKRKLNAS